MILLRSSSSLQAPIEYQRRFASITDDNRRVYHAMVAYLDDQLANVTGTMRALGMWDRTLMVRCNVIYATHVTCVTYVT